MENYDPGKVANLMKNNKFGQRGDFPLILIAFWPATHIYILGCSCAYTCTGYSGTDESAAQGAHGI